MAEAQTISAIMPASLRASDAERGEVADLLAKHYMDGRLDRAEFDERLGAALGAKTRGELTALLYDLPRNVPSRPAQPSSRRRPRRRVAPLALICVLGCLVIAAASSIGRTGGAAGARGGGVVIAHSSPAYALVPLLVAVLLVAGTCLIVRFFRHTHERR